MKRLLALAALLALATHGGARESADYQVAPDALTGGGGRSASANYTADAALGSPAGTSTGGTAPAVVARHGFIAQLYQVTALTPSADPPTLDEGAARQLAAAATCDDGTTLALDPAAIAWSVAAGPLTTIDAGGLATAGPVYADTAATARASWAGLTGDLVLTVVDAQPDNYGSYAGDGLDDSWQFDHFGLDNPLAAPDLDPDGDGQDNRFEFTAGLVPTDPLSRFLLRIAAVPGQPQWKHLVFQPLAAGRTYTVEHSPDLSPASWAPLPGTSPSEDLGDQRTVTDTAATAPEKFYRVGITKP